MIMQLFLKKEDGIHAFMQVPHMGLKDAHLKIFTRCDGDASLSVEYTTHMPGEELEEEKTEAQMLFPGRNVTTFPLHADLPGAMILNLHIRLVGHRTEVLRLYCTAGDDDPTMREIEALFLNEGLLVGMDGPMEPPDPEDP